MQAVSDLESRITSTFDSLSPKQRAAARFILDNRYLASFASASEIGEEIGTSAATVVRLCQALGYDGLPALQEAIRHELLGDSRYFTAVERLQRRLSTSMEDGLLPERVFQTDIVNLQRTADMLSSTIFDEAVGALAAAREVLVIGSGATAAAARFLAHSLQVIGLNARPLLDDDIMLSVNLAHVNAEHIVVGISIWRYARSTVEALQQAKARGAATIAITDSLVSPLARQADFAFEVATIGVAHNLSLTALMALLNALIAGVSLRDTSRTAASLMQVDQEFYARNLLLDHDE